jgi:hypothetical protein
MQLAIFLNDLLNGKSYIVHQKEFAELKQFSFYKVYQENQRGGGQPEVLKIWPL